VQWRPLTHGLSIGLCAKCSTIEVNQTRARLWAIVVAVTPAFGIFLSFGVIAGGSKQALRLVSSAQSPMPT
jgi:hypothetical protein